MREAKVDRAFVLGANARALNSMALRQLALIPKVLTPCASHCRRSDFRCALHIYRSVCTTSRL
eukprot:5094913-Pleurochrysis_carterae.AAC.1